MKIGTLLKAGSLALDIFNHQSTQQLTGLVSNGIKRRGFLQQGVLPQRAAAPQATANQATAHQAQPGARSRPMAAGQARALPPQQPQPGLPQGQWPDLPVRQALKYVTPDNMKKAMQWHGIIKSFIEKD